MTKPKMEGEFRSGNPCGSTFVRGESLPEKSLIYSNVEGMAIFEGDIILGAIDELQPAMDDSGIALQSVGITGQQFRWPNATIPYDIDPALPNQQRITDAIAHWQQNTCIRFVLRNASNAAQYPNFVHFQPGNGCSSFVGMRGGSQALTLGAGCSVGNVIHEIGHAVGLWHEQSREDRDRFVRINWGNIDANMQHNFSQHIADGDDLGAYDYCSIMHYPATAFSTNGQPTIVPLQPIPAGCAMGQRNGLSAGDIAGVSSMYRCGQKLPIRDTIKEVRKDPIRDTIKEVRKDPISDTIKEVRKDPISDTIKEVRKDPISDTIKEVRKDPIRDPIKRPGFDPIGTLVENVTQPGGGLINPGLIGGLQGDVGLSPFVLDTPSQFGGNYDQVAVDAQGQLAEIEAALLDLKRQEAELMTAYQAVLETLSSLGGV
ncbi:MAG: Dot/Icm T4SS effector Zinc-dependent metalloprotease LegP [Pseudomonadota bacterium]